MIPKPKRIFQPSLFKQYIRSKMTALLQSIAGKKILMFDIAISTLVDLIVDKNMQLQHDIPNGLINFQVLQLDSNFDQIVILLIPTPKNLKKLRDLIIMNIEKKPRKFYPVFWPKRTAAARQFFKEEKLLVHMDMKDFTFDLLPIDIDLYSLQIKCIKELYVDHDCSIYTTVAQSIHRLQCAFGKIHNIFYKGKASKAVHDILRHRQHQIKMSINQGNIQTLIILDRSVDFLTPLLLQTTYQGMIDQFFGINGGITKVPSVLYEQAREKQSSDTYKSISLNSEEDYIYQQIRYLSIYGARAVLKSKAAQFDRFVQQSNEMKDPKKKIIAAQRIATERKFFKKHVKLIQICLEQMKTISFHKQLILQQQCLLDKSQDMVEYFENLIAFETPLQKILRYMSIQSLADKGVHRKTYSKICEDIVYTYGPEHIVSLTNLAKLGFFYESGSSKEPFPFTQIKRQMKLISQSPINHENPAQSSFAYGGYTPILTRLVEEALKGGWKNKINKVLKMLPGEYGMPQNIKQCTSHPKPAIVVYFIGGVTYGEIQTIRLLDKFVKRQIVIATTQIINGDKLIRSIIEESQ